MILRTVSLYLLFLLLGATSLTSDCEKQRRPNRYLIPDGYVGWVKVYFNLKDEPALPIEDGHYLYKFPASGVIKTSSAPEFGEASDEHFYYSDETRRPLKTTLYGEGGMIWGDYDGSAATASMGENTADIPEERQARYSGVFVGTEDQYTKYGLKNKDKIGSIHNN